MKYLYIALLALGAMSCSKSFLELTPEDSYSSDNFYRTEAQFSAAINAAYVPLRDLANNDYFTSEMRSDNSRYEQSSDRGTAYLQRENISDFTNTSTNAYTNAVYFHCYKIISRCNVIIERLAAAAIPDATKKSVDGQAKFLRAFAYFKLVRLYGDVPLYLHEIQNVDQAFVSRSPAANVYKQIISDANDAIAELAAPAKFPQDGRATKGSATVLLADVYVTQQRYADAQSLLESLPAMGYGLNTNYADAFSTTNKNSKESLFEIQYLAGTSTGSAPSNFIYQFMARSSNTLIVTGVATSNTSVGGWNIPTSDLIKAYESGDKRLDASIGIAEGTYNSSLYLAISANKSVVNYTPAAGKVGVPYVKKYLHTHTVANNTDDNWPVYRYADALLLLAEALNEQQKGSEALVPLNAIRMRAGLAPATTTDQAALRAIILHERRVELAFENKRWHDLVRTGNAVAVMNTFGTQLKQQYSYLSADAYNVDNNKLLFPIPQSEREVNPDLTQNDGY